MSTVNNDTNIFGFDDTKGVLWHGILIKDHNSDVWISTGNNYMLVRHHNLEMLLTFWLEREPRTKQIQTSYKIVSVPTVIPHTLAQLVLKDIEIQEEL